MIKQLLTLSIIASVCAAKLVPVSEYIGDHKFKCGHGSAITGARVDDKLYTFGGCYPIPYIVDPNDDDYEFMHFSSYDHTNVSDTIQVYDIPNNKWTAETEITTPYPWRKAATQTSKQNIYFYNIRTRDYDGSRSSTLWKYVTNTKEWSRLEDFPFIWHGTLASCQYGGKMYFTGTDDGYQRNIIQTFNAVTEKWEKPIFPNKRITRVRQMLCNEISIHFLGVDEKENSKDISGSYHSYRGGIHRDSFDLISVDYDTGDTFSRGLNITANFGKVSVYGDSFYALNIEQRNSTITKVDTTTAKQIILGTFPYTLENPLVVPYENDRVLLFGGGKEQNRMRYFRNMEDGGKEHINTIKTYNHKLIPENGEVRFLSQE